MHDFFGVSLHKKCAAWDLKVKDTPRKFDIDTQSWAVFESFDQFSKAHHFRYVYKHLCQFSRVFTRHAKTTSWMPWTTSNRCSTRQSAPLRFRSLCRAAAGQLEQRREAQRRRRAECEAWPWLGWRGVGMDGGDLSSRRCFLWWFFVNCLTLIICWCFWISVLFLRLCWLVLKSCLFRFDFLIYIILG